MGGGSTYASQISVNKGFHSDSMPHFRVSVLSENSRFVVKKNK